MTGMGELPPSPDINRRNFEKAVRLAQAGGVTTILFTGKGEPLLYPEEITHYLEMLDGRIPLLELQTNALMIARLVQGKRAGKLTEDVLRGWYEMGLNTIAISTVGINPAHNSAVYLGGSREYPDLSSTVDYLHRLGFQVRLGVMMQKGMVDTSPKMREVVEWCRQREIAQLTFRPIRAPEASEHQKVSAYVRMVGMSQKAILALYDTFRDAPAATLLQNLMHGTEVWDYAGQNVCLSDCLTHSPDTNEMRQIIFYANGRLAYSWTHQGATILQGRR
tara:strand:+ start:25396 stop:26226 length:831 start_codon:yes stop_codon:yes gene_type:complete